MHRIAATVGILLAPLPVLSGSRAQFLDLKLSGKDSGFVHVIWRPHAGVVGSTVHQQQLDVQAMLRVPNYADSARRWQDPAARDTIRLALPTELIIDMGAGPVVVEAANADTIQVDAQLVGDGGRTVKRGRGFEITVDRRVVKVEVRP